MHLQFLVLFSLIKFLFFKLQNVLTSLVPLLMLFMSDIIFLFYFICFHIPIKITEISWHCGNSEKDFLCTKCIIYSGIL